MVILLILKVDSSNEYLATKKNEVEVLVPF